MVKTKGRFLQRTIQWRCLTLGWWDYSQYHQEGKEKHRISTLSPWGARLLISSMTMGGIKVLKMPSWQRKRAWFGSSQRLVRLQQSISWIMELLQEPPKKWNLKPIPYRFPHDGCPIEKIRNHLHQIQVMGQSRYWQQRITPCVQSVNNRPKNCAHADW